MGGESGRRQHEALPKNGDSGRTIPFFGGLGDLIAVVCGEFAGFEFGTVIAAITGVRDQVAECALE